MIYHSRLDKTPITINVNPNAIYGILLSGGLDSAVLLYLFLRTCQEQNVTPNIRPFTIPKTDGSYLYVGNVINWMNQHFSIQIPKHTLVGDPTVHHREQSSTAIHDVFVKFPKIDYLFIGINQNPPAPFPVEGPTRDSASNNSYILCPLVDLYKTHIADLIYEYNLQELLDITHSCTERTAGRCMECFQCQERAWAFEQLNQTDIGTR